LILMPIKHCVDCCNFLSLEIRWRPELFSSNKFFWV
jgi:hypothetical protein